MKLKLPHSTYQILPKDRARWRQPPGDALVSGYCGACASSPTSKNPGYGTFPPDLVQLRSTLPVGALWLYCNLWYQYVIFGFSSFHGGVSIIYIYKRNIRANRKHPCQSHFCLYNVQQFVNGYQKVEAHTIILHVFFSTWYPYTKSLKLTVPAVTILSLPCLAHQSQENFSSNFFALLLTD